MAFSLMGYKESGRYWEWPRLGEISKNINQIIKFARYKLAQGLELTTIEVVSMHVPLLTPT